MVLDAGLPVTVLDAGLPVMVLDAGLPVMVLDAGLPVMVLDAGLPVTVLNAGLPVMVLDAGLPAIPPGPQGCRRFPLDFSDKKNKQWSAWMKCQELQTDHFVQIANHLYR